MKQEKSMLLCERMVIPKTMVGKCLRCGHEWIKRTAGRPARCPGCKTPYWDTKPGELPMGRPPKKKRV